MLFFVGGLSWLQRHVQEQTGQVDTWAGRDSAAVGASFVGCGLQDAEAAWAGLVVQLLLFELALAGLVDAALLLKLDTGRAFASANGGVP